jgi:hypothetical protein
MIESLRSNWTRERQGCGSNRLVAFAGVRTTGWGVVDGAILPVHPVAAAATSTLRI